MIWKIICIYIYIYRSRTTDLERFRSKLINFRSCNDCEIIHTLPRPLLLGKKKHRQKTSPILLFRCSPLNPLTSFHHFLQFCMRHQRRFRPSRNPRFESARYSSSSRSLDIVRTRRSCVNEPVRVGATRTEFTVCMSALYVFCTRAYARKRENE